MYTNWTDFSIIKLVLSMRIGDAVETTVGAYGDDDMKITWESADNWYVQLQCKMTMQNAMIGMNLEE